MNVTPKLFIYMKLVSLITFEILKWCQWIFTDSYPKPKTGHTSISPRIIDAFLNVSSTLNDNITCLLAAFFQHFKVCPTVKIIL